MMCARARFNSRGKQRGFTLIEILTVVMLVGFVVGGVSVFFSQDGVDQRLKKTVERFVVICDHVSELAILSGEPIGLMLDPPAWRQNPLDEGWRYSWVKRVNQEWQELPEVPPVEIENTIELLVFIEEQEWKYDDRPKDKLSARQPLLAFYPSGEVTPFEIEFVHDEVPSDTQTVTVDLWGKVVWQEREEELQALDEAQASL